MAYNPFNIFRRNQKAIFAVITVFIMFTFVLSSGLSGSADFFNWLPEWLGRKAGKKGDFVCKLDGEKVYKGTLQQLQFQRVMANRFMYLAAQQTRLSLDALVTQQLGQVTDQATRSAILQGPMAEEALRNPGLSQQQSFMAQMMVQRYRELLSSPNTKQSEKELARLRQFQVVFDEQVEFMRRNGELYFLNVPNRSDQDLIDFMLWQKKADQLGIRFSTEDVARLIQREFNGMFRSDVPVRKELQEHLAGFNMDNCLQAINEEFRVRAAQSALLGSSGSLNPAERTFGGPPIFNLPYEMYEDYKEKCSPTSFDVVPVPAAAFIDKVTGEPTKQEMDDLFERYKTDEPNPKNETPGFKTPRRVKLEWISAIDTEPYYQKLAAEALKVGELQARIGSMLAVPLLGEGPSWAAAAVTPLAMKDPLLQLDEVRREYKMFIEGKHQSAMGIEWFSSNRSKDLLDSSVVRSPNLAAALGGFVGSGLTFAGPLPGIGNLGSAAWAIERRDRIRAGMPVVMGAIPGPGMFATVIAGASASSALLPRALPIDVVKHELVEKIVKSTARRLMTTDMDKFKTDLAKHYSDEKARLEKENAAIPEKDKRKDKTQLAAALQASMEKYILDYTKVRGWQHGASQQARDQWTIEEDPGLTPLVGLVQTGHHGDRLIQFGERFFWTREFNVPGLPPRPAMPATGLYTAEFYPDRPNEFTSPEARPEPRYLVWRTEELPAKEPPRVMMDAEKALVRGAWKRMKARDLARARAEDLANSVRASSSDSPFQIDQTMNEIANKLRTEISDPKVKDKVDFFQINNVSPLTKPSDIQMMMAGMMQPFRLEPTKNIPYPGPAMSETLLAERTKAPKTTFVMVDAPKDTYYVATVRQRELKSVEEFQSQIFTRGGQMDMGRGFRMVFLDETRRKMFESVLDMLKKEFRYEVTDEQKKKLQQTERHSSQTD
jgi:hypothetical protein